MLPVVSAEASTAPVLLQFSFPRTGGHYLTHCLHACYDIVGRESSGPGGIIWPSEPSLAMRDSCRTAIDEIRDRDNEINPFSRYALTLRHNGTARFPLQLVHDRTGMHGIPGGFQKGEIAVILIRDPIATVYSLYRVSRDRWFPDRPFTSDSVRINLLKYMEFYDAGLEMRRRHGPPVRLVRYEDLVRSPAALRGICEFIGQPSKLEAEFVWQVTHFENFTTVRPRTFYREGRNDAWRQDAPFLDMLAASSGIDFRPFGYPPVAESLETCLPGLTATV